MGKKIHTYLLAALFLFAVAEAKAQTDPASLEAMISNHKTVRTVLEVRAIAELGVYNYHKNSATAAKEYKNINDSLDLYRRAFDVIDLLLKGTATAFHGVNTYNRVKSNLTGYWKLVDTYNRKILSHGAVWTSDTLILNTSRRAVEEVAKEASEIYTSLYDLSTIVAGKNSPKEARTSDLMIILDKINSSMDHIDASIHQAYLDLWSYMTVRIGYWKKEIYMARDIKDIVNDAYGRWKKSQNEAAECSREHKSYSHEPLGGGGLLGERRRKEESI